MDGEMLMFLTIALTSSSVAHVYEIAMEKMQRRL